MIASNVPNQRPNLAKFNFSGHETFPLRFAWLPKGMRYVEANSSLDSNPFSEEKVLIELGVGKNMVSSIRHWCSTMGVITNEPKVAVTDLGHKLLSEKGWDPYLEDIGTLWLFHWQIVSNAEKASTWLLSFTQWSQIVFTRTQLTHWLNNLVENAGQKVSPNSLKRDVDVFVRTYVPSEPVKSRAIEESFDSPLVELGLITETAKDTFQFAKGEKPTLPDEIFIYALMNYWNTVAPERQTLEFGKILHGLGSPGGAFALTSNALVERLERLPKWASMRFDDTAGIKQLLRNSNKPFEPMLALEHYYGGASK